MSKMVSLSALKSVNKYSIALFVCCLLMLNTGSVVAQLPTQPEIPRFDAAVDFLPPPPNATAMIEYGKASLNKNTGTPIVNIPLYTLKGNKLSTTVSLGYSSSGIRVDEVASRVGMGWSLNAGGVITRVVRGLPDEGNFRHYPYAPIGQNTSTFMYMYRITEAAKARINSVGLSDSEPDIYTFSFDGESGSFVLDVNLNPVLINKSGLKIEKNFGSSDWNFKITNTEGVVYVFGGNGCTEKTKRTSTCSRSYDELLPSSWYLKKIIHPSGEQIFFTYMPIVYHNDNGVSQTTYGPPYETSSYCPCGVKATETCVNKTETAGVLLTEIATQGSRIGIEYMMRPDCDDRLVQRITYGEQTQIHTSYYLTYSMVTSTSIYTNEEYEGNNYTPYLTQLEQKSFDNAISQKHEFSYIDPGGRPPRLSFSQDHWGFFNGKVNTHFTTDLKAASQNIPSVYSDADADREADWNYTQKGLLQKIIYPTGGYSIYSYEPNMYDDPMSDYETNHQVTCEVTGIGNEYVVGTKTINFSLSETDNAVLNLQCRDNGIHDLTVEPWIHHVQGTVKIYKVTTPGVSLYEKEFGPSQPFNEYVTFPPGDYQMKITATGEVVTTIAKLSYSPGKTQSTIGKKVTGGMRVGKITNWNSVNGTTVKKYYYGTTDDLNASSLVPPSPIQYEGYMQEKLCVVTPNISNSPLWIPVFTTCPYSYLASSSIRNLGYYNNNSISYQAIVESNGENFEGGGTETKYYVDQDVEPEIVWVETLSSDYIRNAPLQNHSSIYNAKVYSEKILKKFSNGDLKTIKSSEYTYENNPAKDDVVLGYTVTKVPQNLKFQNEPDTTWTPPAVVVIQDGYLPQGYGFELTTLMHYFIMAKYRIHSTWVHPESETVTTYDENGENPVVMSRYFTFNEADYQLRKSESTNSIGLREENIITHPSDFLSTQPYGSMVEANMLTPIISSVSKVGGYEQTKNIINYTNNAGGLILPSTFKKSFKGAPEYTEGTIDEYDNYGNVLQYTGKDGIKKSIVWGYNYRYPVAEIVNADIASVTTALGVTVADIQQLDGTALESALNNIRQNLPGAFVTTYTYKNLVGVSSITDPNGKTTTYEYDSFDRLKIVRDQDGKIVKLNQYSFADHVPITVFTNTLVSQSFNCQTCQPGYAPIAPVSYSVPAGKYFSTISQNAADDLAQQEIQQLGQEYANKNSICSNTTICTGEGYKFVGCGCELGIYVSTTCSTVNANGGWTNYNLYKYSDNSTATFSVEVPPCTGVDKKKIGCDCETGTRVCDATPVDNGNGSYSVSYHYHWSDNSNGPVINETISCQGVDKKIINCGCETAKKVYVSSEQCNLPNGIQCCHLNQWKCRFYYEWSDGSTTSQAPQDLFEECNNSDCMNFND